MCMEIVNKLLTYKGVIYHYAHMVAVQTNWKGLNSLRLIDIAHRIHL